MHNLAEYIAHSNLINFLVLAFIIALVFQKAIKTKINDAYKENVKEVEDSEVQKNKSFEKLAEIKASYESIDFEINEILDNAKQIITKNEARLKQEFEEIKEKFSQDAKKIIAKQIENINFKTKKEITETAIYKAEEKIKNMLKDKESHRKFQKGT